MIPMNLPEIQSALRDERLDGWLFFDHHVRDALAYRILGIPLDSHVTRRWYYFIPASGEPRGLVHRIEPSILNGLPGALQKYSGWNTQLDGLRAILGSAKRIAMQYSPNCAIPYVSMVDAGTIELIRSLGIDVATSANLIQFFEARWSPTQFETHLEAGRRVDAIRHEAFDLIGARLSIGINEYEVQQFIMRRFTEEGMITDHGPIVGANANASNPHYSPQPEGSSPIHAGDSVLIDMWAKLNEPDAVYYDITWDGYCGKTPPDRLRNVFEVVRDARDKAIDRVQQAVSAGESLEGWQVDDAARHYIRECGFEEYFVHRLGHSIGTEVHGTGANMDNLETHDERRIIPSTCFSIEPGVYLPEFGIRSEVNVFIGDGEARVTGEMQRSLVLIH